MDDQVHFCKACGEIADFYGLPCTHCGGKVKRYRQLEAFEEEREETFGAHAWIAGLAAAALSMLIGGCFHLGFCAIGVVHGFAAAHRVHVNGRADSVLEDVLLCLILWGIVAAGILVMVFIHAQAAGQFVLPLLISLPAAIAAIAGLVHERRRRRHAWLDRPDLRG